MVSISVFQTECESSNLSILSKGGKISVVKQGISKPDKVRFLVGLYLYGYVAQLAERQAVNLDVVCSNHTIPAIYWHIAQLDRAMSF